MRRSEMLNLVVVALAIVAFCLLPSPLRASVGDVGLAGAQGRNPRDRGAEHRGHGARGKGVLLSEQVYQWTDKDGGVHFTDNPEDIPSRDRDRVEEISLPDYPENAVPGPNDAADDTSAEETAPPSSDNPSDPDASGQGKVGQGQSAQEREGAAAAGAIIPHVLPQGPP